ncbi:MAG: hypothetical protein MZW92_01170 [Comamonadaceae bacterium]|nr:hypothetical protein [Comamonadaceae bacterium]
MSQIRVVLDESEIPTHWYNVVADMPEPARAGRCSPAPASRSTPGRRCCRSSRWRCIEQEMSAERWIDDPRRGARDLPAVAPVAAVPRPPPGAGARHPGEDLLQVRGRLAGRLAQAQHRRRRRPTTTSRPASSASPPRPAPASGARRMALAGQMFGLEVHGLHGQGQLRPEALPHAR